MTSHAETGRHSASTTLAVAAYGGGVQSTAMLVLAAQRRLDLPVFLFANTGDDSEHRHTLHYVRTVAAPFARANGITLHELHRTRRDGSIETLYGRLTRPGSRSLPIPVRMASGAPGTRSCTTDFKIIVIGRWPKAHSATGEHPADVSVGISLDEWHRAHNRRVNPYERVVYPLLDLRLDRSACMRVIRDAGLPVHGESACYFCPFRRPSAFAEMRRDQPDLFARACALEDLRNGRRRELGKEPVWLTRFNAPLADAVAAAREPLPGMDVTDDISCDNGACFT